MKYQCHIILTNGRNVVGGAPIDREQATALYNILTQEGADLQDTVGKLEAVFRMSSITGRKFSRHARVQASLRDKTTGLYVSAGMGLLIPTAQLLIKAVRLNNEPGLQTMIGDLRKIIAGTAENNHSFFPFLPTEGFLQKA